MYTFRPITDRIARMRDKVRDRVIVADSANDLNISLTEEQKQTLTDLFNRLKELDIDWGQVKDQVSNAKDKLTEFFSSEEGQNFLDKLKEIINAVIDWFKELFK